MKCVILKSRPAAQIPPIEPPLPVPPPEPPFPEPVPIDPPVPPFPQPEPTPLGPEPVKIADIEVDVAKRLRSRPWSYATTSGATRSAHTVLWSIAMLTPQLH